MSYGGKVLAALAIAAGVLLLWQLRQVFLLVFGGLIVATVLLSLARLAARLAGTGHRASLAMAVGFLLLSLALLGWWVGEAVAAQLDALRENAPLALDALRRWLSQWSLGRNLLKLWQEATQDGLPWSRVAQAAGLTLTALGHLLLILLVGLFLAAEPDLYRRGVVRLVPVPRRRAVEDAFDACAKALRGWLKGQALSMLFVGVATGLGLKLLGVPLALILGLLAGLLDFVPFFGPIAAGAVAVVFAFVEGPQTALYVALLMLAIQQLEGNLVLPLAQRWTVHLPPALTVLSVLAFGGVFGVLGVVFATPLTVVLMVLVRKLYVEDLLEARVAG